MRDSQRQRLYDAENAAAHANGDPHWAQTIANDQLQRWVDDVLRRNAIRARWPSKQITVTLSRGGGRAYGSTISLGVAARNPWVVLHEIAHCLASPGVKHGPEYAGVYLFLVRSVLGRDAGKHLLDAYRAHRVRHNRSGIPRRRAVKPLVEIAAAERQRSTRPPSRVELAEAADVLRRAIRAGMFGDSGRKPRTHANETARRLEGS